MSIELAAMNQVQNELCRQHRHCQIVAIRSDQQQIAGFGLRREVVQLLFFDGVVLEICGALLNVESLGLQERGSSSKGWVGSLARLEYEAQVRGKVRGVDARSAFLVFSDDPIIGG